MTVEALVQALLPPAWAALAIIVVATLASHLLGGPGAMALPFLDLRHEANLGAWLAAVFLLLAALSCVQPGWGQPPKGLKHPWVWFFRIAACGCLVLSALEITQGHVVFANWLGKAYLAELDQGFLILGFLTLPVLAAAWLYYLRICLGLLSAARVRRRLLKYVGLIGLGFPLWLALDVVGHVAWGKYGSLTLLACFEESLESALALAFGQINVALIMGLGGD